VVEKRWKLRKSEKKEKKRGKMKWKKEIKKRE